MVFRSGGGAGGAVYMTDVPLNGEYAITVGKGGVSSDNDDTHSTNGENSSISNATEAVVDVAIDGGAGRTFYLLGYAEVFAGGGGAGAGDKEVQLNAGLGGIGGGGNGGWSKMSDTDDLAKAGEDGLGAGGGGGGGGGNATDANKLAGKGGDGIVIIRYTAEPMGLMLLLQ